MNLTPLEAVAFALVGGWASCILLAGACLWMRHNHHSYRLRAAWSSMETSALFTSVLCAAAFTFVSIANL